MRFLFALLIAAITPAAFAISDADLTQACWDKGVEKIVLTAKNYENCAIDEREIFVSEIDNRWYNPSKYIWYSVKAECSPFGEITKMVQYYRGRCI